MGLRDIAINVYNYTYLILIVGSLIIYGLNFGDYKEDAYFCAYQYDDPLNKYIKQMYWKDNGLCCHYALNEHNDIIQECR